MEIRQATRYDIFNNEIILVDEKDDVVAKIIIEINPLRDREIREKVAKIIQEKMKVFAR